MTTVGELTGEDKRQITEELEELLHEHRFHVCGLSPDRPSSLGTYMGVLDFGVISAVIENHPDRDWKSAADVWDSDFDSTGSPTFRILAEYVRGRLPLCPERE